MQPKKIEPPVDIAALHRAVEAAKAGIGRNARRLVVGRRVFDQLVEEVRPYAKWKTNQGGTWFLGLRVEVSDEMPDDAAVHFDDWHGGRPPGAGRAGKETAPRAEPKRTNDDSKGTA